MKVRFGYVAIAMRLEKVTSSSPVTYKKYSSIDSERERLSLLKKVTQSNLNDLIKILNYNIENDIHFYRLTSKLIPLATHQEVRWDYSKVIQNECQKVARLIQEFNMRIDAHPDQFNVLNSVNESVIESSIKTLQHQLDLFDLFQIKHGKLVLHVGGKAGGKEAALERFEQTFTKLPSRIQQALILENDDKTYSANDVLGLCQRLHIPMVLDIHHHRCYHEGEFLEALVEPIFNTWEGDFWPPKIHVSSPREFETDRRHADFIEVEDMLRFLDLIKPLNQDIDVMIEAKQKDLALHRLVHDIRQARPNWQWLDHTTVEI
ncbi:MAG: UV DNA damage repair endonuclease UvsE [Turicibacter sp.]|nr:UV DNA damage repair endonuclease UvsE [Turicibacter sp.]